ncbi:MAG TPA: glycosyltransferase family 9 protein [Pyrinomonadaceae bacterium]
MSFVLRLKARFALGLKDALNDCLRVLRAVLFLRLRPPLNPGCVVVHLIGNVGDVLVAVPALMALRERYPQSRLVLLTSAGPSGSGHAGARELLDGVSFLDRIEAYSTDEIRGLGKMLKLLRRIRGLRPDLMVSLPPCNISLVHVIRNLVFARLTGARFGVGYELVSLKFLAYAQALAAGLYPGEIARNLAHLSELDAAALTAVRFELGPLTAEEGKQIDELLSDGRPFIALCPGGKQVGHRWPAERFAEVARRLRRESGCGLLAVGSSAERELCDAVLEAAGGGMNLAGSLSLRGTAELLSRAQLLLTNDTGPMHLAAVMNTPVVAIFGTRDLAGRWSPHGAGHELFRAVMVCKECLFAATESDHCVKRIGVEEVLAGCRRVLERRGVGERGARTAPLSSKDEGRDEGAKVCLEA